MYIKFFWGILESLGPNFFFYHLWFFFFWGGRNKHLYIKFFGAL